MLNNFSIKLNSIKKKMRKNEFKNITLNMLYVWMKIKKFRNTINFFKKIILC